MDSCLVDKGELVEDVPADYCDSLGATYIDTMKTLVDTYCATSSGCNGNLSINGDFTSYGNMQNAGVLDPLGLVPGLHQLTRFYLWPLGNPLPDSLTNEFLPAGH